MLFRSDLLGSTEQLPCPALENLALFFDQTCQKMGYTDRLRAMVEARAARGCPMRDLLLGCYVFDPPDNAFLAAVTAQGARTSCVDTGSRPYRMTWVLRGPAAHHVPEAVHTEWIMLRQQD